MRKKTMFVVGAVLAVAVLGVAVAVIANGNQPSRTARTQTKLRPSATSASSGIPSFWNADTRAGCTTAEYGSGWCRASVTRQCNATPENQEEKELSQAACSVLREVPATSEHTPEEQEKRRDNLGAEEKAAHEEEALEKTSGAGKACEEERRTQEKLRYEYPNSPPEPQREAEYEQMCGH